MDIKRQIVIELATEYHAAVLSERCPKDDHPLVKFANDPRPWCIVEIKKNELATQDRAKLLVALKMESMQAMAQSQAQFQAKYEPLKKRDLSMYEVKDTLSDLLQYVERHRHFFAKMKPDEVCQTLLKMDYSLRDVAIWKLRQQKAA